MSAPLDRIEVWTDLACNSGVAKADLPIVDATACTLVEEIVNSLVQRRLTVTVPLLWSDKAELVLRRVLRVVYSDSTPFDEFRIHRLTRSAVGGTITIEARGIEFDLGERNQLVTVTVNGQTTSTVTDAGTTATTALTNRSVAAAPSYWAIGTVTPADTIDMGYSNDTPLSAALKVVAAVKTASGIAYEISARRNGTTGYFLDCTIYNTAATVPDLLQSKSLLETRVLDDTQDHATRIYGADAAFMRPTFQVSALTANTWIEVQEVNGLGAGPAREDTQWANDYWVEEKNGTAHLITACTKQSYGTTRLSMASTATIAVADRGYLALNSSGDDIAYVDSPSLQTTWGINVKSIPSDASYTNYLRNADFRGDTAGVPTSWAKTGSYSTFARTTTAGLFKTGGASYRLVSSGPSNLQQTVTVQLAAGDFLHLGGWIYITNFSTAGDGNLVLTAAGVTVTVLLDGTDSQIKVLNTWYWVSRSVSVATAGVKTINVALGTLGGGAWACYWDGAHVCFSRAATQPAALIIGSGAANNVGRMNRYFDTNGTPPSSYDIQILDLYRMDPTGVGVYEALSLGGTANITDTDLGVTVSPRVVRVETNYLTAHDTRLTLSTQPRELTRVLAA